MDTIFINPTRWSVHRSTMFKKKNNKLKIFLFLVPEIDFIFLRLSSKFWQSNINNQRIKYQYSKLSFYSQKKCLIKNADVKLC